MNLFYNLKSVPKWLLDAIVLIPLMIFINIFSDGPYLSHIHIVFLMAIYAFNWFVWRIMLAGFGLYSFSELLHPVIFMIIPVVIMAFTFYNHPDYHFDNNHLSGEEVAADCPNARWVVHVNYSYNDGFLHSSEDFFTKGNTEMAQNFEKRIAQNFNKARPDFKFEFSKLSLYYMPRKFCQEKGYKLDWSEGVKNPLMPTGLEDRDMDDIFKQPEKL